MSGEEMLDVEISDDVGRFAETYSSFNKIINKIQRQYLSLKEIYTQQSEELQSVNETLQDLMKENRAVTEFLNSILNSLSSGVIAVDISGKISHMNPAAMKILGIENNAPSNSIDYNEIVRTIDNENCSALVAMKNGNDNISGEKKIKTLYGTILILSVSTSVLLNRSNEIVGAVEMFHDITKLKCMEDQLAQMKVLASMGEMAASIAHEVRNPLVGVGGFASLLARDLENDPSKRDMARKIVEGVDSINNIIQTLLDFARRERVEKSEVDLNAYLRLILDNFKEDYGLTENNGEIDIDLPAEGSIKVDLDRHLFKQALTNLVKNGLEANKDGTKSAVRIVSRILPIEKAQNNYKGKIELSGTETLAEITIVDNGPGIASDDLARLFSPFYSTKENGIGLGLSIAWKIIKAHGGDISAESKLGRGTKFSIVLPIKSNRNGVER